MSYSLQVTKTATNVPTIAGNLIPDGEIGYLPSAVAGAPYVMDLVFRLYEVIDEFTQTQVPITAFSSNTPDRTGVTFTVTDSNTMAYGVRISGTLNVPLFNSTYDIVIPTATGSALQTGVSTSGTLPSYLAIVKWSPPTVFWSLLSDPYVFVANDNQVSEATLTLDQYLYWNWTGGLSKFKTDLQAGSI